MNKLYGTNPKTQDDVQICTYAICKNELKFLDDWVNNIWNNGKGSNYIVVLDTGSTDGTYERLQSISKDFNIPDGHFIYSQAKITPWRFDVARNMSLALCPKPTLIDVCYCVDLDEKVDNSFWEELRKTVFAYPDYYRIFYQYAWSHKSNGEPDLFFWYDKIHGPIGWQWEYPVHETLTCCASEKYSTQTFCLSPEKILLHHYPDQTKSRGSYLKLLEIRVRENPEDLISNFYLAREYSFNYDWENCKKYSQKALDLFHMNLTDTNTFSAIVCLLSKCYDKLGDRKTAIKVLEDARKEFTSRYIYISLAQLVVYTGDYSYAFRLLNEIQMNTRKVNSWQIPAWVNSNWKYFQIEADAYAWQGNYCEAHHTMKLALADITDSDIWNATEQGLFADSEFIENKWTEEINKE